MPVLRFIFLGVRYCGKWNLGGRPQLHWKCIVSVLFGSPDFSVGLFAVSPWSFQIKLYAIFAFYTLHGCLLGAVRAAYPGVWLPCRLAYWPIFLPTLINEVNEPNPSVAGGRIDLVAIKCYSGVPLSPDLLLSSA